RQVSMWRCTGRSTPTPPPTVAGRSRATSSHSMGHPLVLVVEQVTQLLAAPVEADLGRGDGDAELSCDLLVGEPVDVLQDHDRPQLRGELAERDGDGVEALRRLGG